MLTLGDSIRMIRTARGLTASDACKVARVSNPMWSLIEQDKRQPAHDTLLRIAKALDAPCDVFLIVLGFKLETTDAVHGIVKALKKVKRAEEALRQLLDET